MDHLVDVQIQSERSNFIAVVNHQNHNLLPQAIQQQLSSRQLLLL